MYILKLIAIASISAIPFLVDPKSIGQYVNDDWAIWKITWTILGCLIFVGSLTYTCIYEISEYRHNKKVRKRGLEEHASLLTLKYIDELNREKAEHIRRQTYACSGGAYADFNIRKNVVPYDIHWYIKKICEALGMLISEMTGVDIKNISVGFVYKYRDDDFDKWKWIEGEEESYMYTLKDLFGNKRSFFYYLYQVTSELIVIENDKRRLERRGHYIPISKDDTFNESGSIVGQVIRFGNNETCFVEGILTVNTYGEKLASDNVSARKVSEKELKHILSYIVLEYFKGLFVIELGFLYKRNQAINSENVDEKALSGRKPIRDLL